MNVILFDHPQTKTNLLPFTFTRPISEIRIGILTIREKWEKWLPADYSFLCDSYLQNKFQQLKSGNNLYLNGSVLPDKELVDAIKELKGNQILQKGNTIIAFYGNLDDPTELMSDRFDQSQNVISFDSELISVNYVFDIFLKNRQAIISDFELLTKGRKSQEITDPHTITYNSKDIFIEENVTLKSALLNAESGPIYIGEGAEIGERSIIKGTTSIGEYSILNLGARIRGDATIGPHSKVGGEISNSVIFGYSSKAHEGFLGNSVIGEWCNMGADSNTSNLKNNYKNVKIWNYGSEQFENTGRQFCGLMMADHSKCGINTMFNTGTVVGVSANIFGCGFPRTFIPSFSWGGSQGFSTFRFDKALEVMPKVLERRKKVLTEEDIEVFEHIFEMTKKYRSE